MNMKKNLILPTDTIKNALYTLKKNGEKNLIVVDNNNYLLGAVSDGDIRNAILNRISLNEKILTIYNQNCIFFYNKNLDMDEVKKKFLKYRLGLIPIVNNKRKIIKIITWYNIFSNNLYKKKTIIPIPVIIMAGGKGSRLEPFTNILPKPLVPLNDKTVVENIIDQFLIYGIKNFYLSLNYKSKIIKAYFSDLVKDYKIKYIDENKPLGTIGSLTLLPSNINSTFFLSNWEMMVKADYNDLYKYHKDNKNDLTIIVSTKEIVVPYGNCKIDKKGTLLSIKEKPTFNFLVNTGFYIFNKNLIKLIPKDTKMDFNEFIDVAIRKKKKIAVFPIDENSWSDIGQWSEYKKLF